MRQFLWQHDVLRLVRVVVGCLNSFAAAQRPLYQDCLVYGLAGLLRGCQSGGMPGIVIAWELILFGGVIGGDIAAILPGLKAGIPFGELQRNHIC